MRGGRGGKVDYVLEGNLNYTGAVITWLKDDLKLISSAKETEGLAREANPADRTYLVPAFTGLGAPYWDEKATASISGITRTTGKAEVVKRLSTALPTRSPTLSVRWSRIPACGSRNSV